MKILLVEPAYKNKYPPLGLMKISRFHKDRGDDVYFVKGKNKLIRSESWDRVYITTLFSFYWNQTIETINYYKSCTSALHNIFIGGPMATVMAEEIKKITGILPIRGLLNEENKLGIVDDHSIDSLIPDYGILDAIEYKYPATNAYYGYMTRGCTRKCPFCAVPTIEPTYVDYIPLKEQIRIIKERYGEKKDLLLLDNNVLASPHFDKIIDDIIEMGFFKGATYNKKIRNVDFNQGLDLRYLTKHKINRLAEIAIRPLRIAFDHIKLKDQYLEKIEWASEQGLLNLSNYILYNYEDTPEDLYKRLKVNVLLNKKLGTKIFSFPMKYIPNQFKDRSFVGKHWNPKYLRSIQCILNATHGIVGPKKSFFNVAFGKNVNEFKKILLMPEKYILYREKYKKSAIKWNEQYEALELKEKKEFHRVIKVKKIDTTFYTQSKKISKILKHYKSKRDE